MKKCMLFVLSIVALGYVSHSIAGPCYTVGNVGPATTCNWSAIGNQGPCPTGLQLPDTIQTCGYYTYAVVVPLGTYGNQASGQMSQGNGSWVCRKEVHCTKKIGTLSPIWPPVAQVYCAAGAASTCGTTTAFGPTGAACPAGG
ncbi:hypothetical protein Enr17x_33350 [Gimesia fumaroli]|jgi:hypothetical protein|uniref:Secreted protein n=1 Tax=Gimesia fumaroli TaxID=2527976 RepID=A0A518IDZ5_9PLAN|nr:hypothetical protein Enr17x_33350 [Gimesia fumaroli]